MSYVQTTFFLVYYRRKQYITFPSPVKPFPGGTDYKSYRYPNHFITV